MRKTTKKQDRIKSLKIAHITEDLKLTQIEAQNFWPIYNAYEVKKSDLKKTTRKIREQLDMQTINEPDARAVISDMITSERKQHDLKSQFIKDLLTVLPAKKVIQLKLSENEFNKRMLREIRQRKRKL
jgi:hypothetical protein